MYSKHLKVLLFFIGIITLMTGCGSSTGGEHSKDTLLDDNTPPIAYDQNITLSNLELKENGELYIALKATDKDGDTLEYTIIQYPAHGTLSGNLPTVIYIPDNNYIGEDHFIFEVNDGIATAQGTIDITITAKEDTDTNSSDENGSINNPQDINSTDINTTLIFQPTHDDNGTTETPTSEGEEDTEDTTDTNVTIHNIPNHIPIVENRTFTIEENTKLNITLTGSDEDHDRLTYALSSYPSHGTLTGNMPDLIYIPDNSYVGEDHFSYIAYDGTSTSTSATITIHIIHINHAPIANNDTISLYEDTNTTINVLLNDIDEDDRLDKKSLTILKHPIHGIVRVYDDNVVYVPYKNYFGHDSLNYSVNDTEGAVSNEAIVNIDVLSVNDAPVAVDDSVVLDNIQAVSIDVLKNDFDIDANQTELKVVSVSQPQFGKSSVSSNLVLYSHTLDSGDTDSFSYTIEDSAGARATANVYIKIYQGDTNSSDINKAPIAYDKYIQIDEDETITFELNATDADNDKLAYILTNSSVLPSHGVIISQDNNTITYKPNREFAGKEYITFVANDGNVSSNQAVVTIEVASVNDAPVANAGENKQGVTGDSLVLDGSKSYDVDGEIVSYAWIEGNQTISTQPTFSKLFTTEGIYRISLRVTDDKNATGMDEVVVDISLCNQGCIHPDPTQTVPFQ